MRHERATEYGTNARPTRPELPVHTRLLTRGAKAFGRGVSVVVSNVHRMGWLPNDREVEVVRDVPYTRRGGKQSVDVYLPRRVEVAAPRPFVVYVHGGGFIIGDRKMGAPMARTLASRGIPVVAIGYRQAPRYGLHEQLDDLDAALRFTLERGREWNLDTERYALVGESAGAHLTMRLVQSFGIATRPRALVGFYGPYDLGLYRRARLPWLEWFLGAVGQGGDVEHLVATHGALRDLPWTDVPVLLVHGGDDRFVPVENSLRMRALLERQGVPVELRIYPGSGHGFNYQRTMNPHHTDDAYRQLVHFFRRHVGE